ncbi:MAG: hypothetical protein OXK78_07555 [Caldilineaceae bacterium]|nr:hypothetical protein [Caldilineaceae bacterium]
MYPFRARPSHTPSLPLHTLAAAAALAFAFILLTVHFASASVANASVADDPQRQASDNRLIPPELTAEYRDGAIELRWDPVPGAVRYQLDVWWDSLPDWERIGGDGVTGTSYRHTDLTAGRTYYYTIQAVNAAGQTSDWQLDYASATVPVAPDNTQPSPTLTPTSTPTPTPTAVASPSPTATAGPAPTSPPVTSDLTPPVLTAAVVDGAIELRWDPVPGAVRYHLDVWWDPLPDWEPLARDGVTGTSYRHTGLTAGRTYHYTIQAVNAAGQTSDWQLDYASATAPAAPGGTQPSPTPTPTSTQPSPTLTPTAVASPSPTATGGPTATSPPVTFPLTPPVLTAEYRDGAIELRWDPVPGAVRYRLDVWWDPLPDWEPLTGDGVSGTSYRHTGLTAGRTYHYTIQAVNAAGQEGDWQLDYASATVPAASQTPQHVAPPPPSLGLEPYYRKYLDAGGIPVIASSDVDDAELYHAREIIFAMLSNRPDLLANMAANRFRVIIYEDDGCRGPYQVPELRDELPPGRCTNDAGIASIRGLADRSTGEVLLVIEAIGVAPAFLPYCNVIFVHEFAHLVDYTLSFRLPGPAVYDPSFMPRVESAYYAAIAAGLYQDAYAATNPREYWAEAVTFWFLPDMLTGLVRTPAHVSKLADYDPRAVSLVEEVFGDAALPDCNPVFFRVLGTVTGPAGNPLSGISVVTDVRVVPEISPYYWRFAEDTLPTTAGGEFVVSVSKPRLAAVQRLVSRETGESDLESHFILGVAAGAAGACPTGYLSSASGKVENIPSRRAAKYAIPRGDLSGISLALAPNFVWTQQICLRSGTHLSKDEN